MTEPLDEQQISQLAQRQLADYDAGHPGTMFEQPLSLSCEDAYRIQDCVTELRCKRGEKVIGYKVGCTSPAIQKQFGIDHRVYARLFASECHSSGVRLSASKYDHLAIEGELAIKLERSIPVTETIINAVGAIVFPVIELHNYVFRSTVPNAPELIANNAIHSGFVMPDKALKPFEIDYLRLSIDGQEMGTVQQTDLIRTASESVGWLASHLASRGMILEKDQIILTGSLLSLFPVKPGNEIAVNTNDCRITALIEE